MNAADSFDNAARNLRSLSSRVNAARQKNRVAMTAAASLATRVSQDTFRQSLVGRPTEAERDHRKTTGGQFDQYIQWEVVQGKYAGYSGPMVKLNDGLLRNAAPDYWHVIEVGTGETAVRLDTGETFAIPSQIGRKIPRRYVWVDASGSPTATGGQLRTLSDVRNRAAVANLGRMTIRNEIQGKHYIQAGWRAGRRQYENELRRIIRDLFPK